MFHKSSLKYAGLQLHVLIYGISELHKKDQKMPVFSDEKVINKLFRCNGCFRFGTSCCQWKSFMLKNGISECVPPEGSFCWVMPDNDIWVTLSLKGGSQNGKYEGRWPGHRSNENGCQKAQWRMLKLLQDISEWRS